MGWGNGIGIGWPNASASAGPTNVYYLIDGWCSEDIFPLETYTTQLVDPNIYHTGDFVFSPDFNIGIVLGTQQSTPLTQVGIIGPNNYSCPVTKLESYRIIDCILGEEYVSGYYDAGNFALGDRVYTQYGNYGWVQNTEIAQEGDQSDGFPIGYVDGRCNDCNVYLSPTLNNGYGESYQYYMDLTAFEQLTEVHFASNDNALNVNVSYYVYFESNEGPGPITRQGEVTFTIPTYFVNAGDSSLLGSIFIFDIPLNDYFISESAIVVTSMSVDNTALGPYDTGWGVPNKYVTKYGNAWTFLINM